MLWLRKSKKGFTLIELMVVVAIIGILALLGLRLFLMQQIRAKNAIVKANAATIHTIIQGNLADSSYTPATAAIDAVNAVCMADGVTPLDGGTGNNTDRPAGMKNPHLTGPDDATGLVVASLNSGVGYGSTALFVTAAEALAMPTYSGVVIVTQDSVVANKFYIIGLDNNTTVLGEVYVAQK